MTIKCVECEAFRGWTERSALDHIRGKHGVDVNMSHIGLFYCNSCAKPDGDSRKFKNFDCLIEHLDKAHDIQIEGAEGADPIWYRCDCGFGSATGASEQSIVNHLRGMHSCEVNMTAQGIVCCNMCTRKSKRFIDFDDFLEHMTDHGIDGIQVFTPQV
jgi:hypothetical protein